MGFPLSKGGRGICRQFEENHPFIEFIANSSHIFPNIINNLSNITIFAQTEYCHEPYPTRSRFSPNHS